MATTYAKLIQVTFYSTFYYYYYYCYKFIVQLVVQKYKLVCLVLIKVTD